MKENKFTINDIIIENEKDQLIFDYLMKIRGKAGIENILAVYFNGATRPYISNIIKYSKIEIPDEILKPKKILSKEESLLILENLKKAFRF